MALGHLMSHAMTQENGEWRIDYANVQLAEGQPLKDFPVRVNRQERTLRLTWREGLPEGTHHIRLAFHNAQKGASQSLEVKAPKIGETVEVLLPKWAQYGALHMWWHPVVNGASRWQSRYIFLPEGVKIVVGWLLARPSMRMGRMGQKGGMAHGLSNGKGLNPSAAGEESTWGGG